MSTDAQNYEETCKERKKNLRRQQELYLDPTNLYRKLTTRCHGYEKRNSAEDKKVFLGNFGHHSHFGFSLLNKYSSAFLFEPRNDSRKMFTPEAVTCVFFLSSLRVHSRVSAAS
ncbi:hypothetical protein AVEN_32159-1 [Araneus ventricosus]|uniref:Uncharacterized protein n=1 Tax=Araneus ventricosus TaxID=182803 RepID=A0A4Y2FHJ3_ARAVE|nr:hypothetical protein AVEN_32159-1 [Araneus ventricosus]